MQLTPSLPVTPVAPKQQQFQFLLAQLKKIQSSLRHVLIPAAATLQVRQFAQGNELWWYAYDPLTGQCLYATSETELRQWIEATYTGH